MSALFADPFHQDLANIALGAISVGAADAGEVAAIAERTTPGDDESFYSAWIAAADAVVAGVASLEPHAARQAYLRAAIYYSIAWHPFLGPTANDHLSEAFGRETQALAQAAARFEPALEAVSIPFPDHDMPGYFMPASGHPSGTRRPLRAPQPPAGQPAHARLAGRGAAGLTPEAPGHRSALSPAATAPGAGRGCAHPGCCASRSRCRP